MPQIRTIYTTSAVSGNHTIYPGGAQIAAGAQTQSCVSNLWVAIKGNNKNDKIEKEDTIRNIFVQKMKEYSENEMPGYRVVVKNDDTSTAIIENWKEVHKFDDFAFYRTDLTKIRVRLK